MGKFDKQLAHWREQYRVAVEDLQDLDSGKKKMAEDTGQGWVDTTDRWRDRIRTEVVLFAQLVEVYEKLDARNVSSWFTDVGRSPPPTSTS
jgi:hypothetical protein